MTKFLPSITAISGQTYETLAHNECWRERARPRWRRSLRAGDGNRPAPPVANRWCAQRARRAREIVRRAEKRAGRLAMASRMLPSSDGGEALSQDKPNFMRHSREAARDGHP